MIEVRNLRKTFGPTVAVDDISFDVRRGRSLVSWDRTERARPPRCGC